MSNKGRSACGTLARSPASVCSCASAALVAAGDGARGRRMRAELRDSARTERAIIGALSLPAHTSSALPGVPAAEAPAPSAARVLAARAASGAACVAAGPRSKASTCTTTSTGEPCAARDPPPTAVAALRSVAAACDRLPGAGERLPVGMRPANAITAAAMSRSGASHAHLPAHSAAAMARAATQALAAGERAVAPRGTAAGAGCAACACSCTRCKRTKHRTVAGSRSLRGDPVAFASYHARCVSEAASAARGMVALAHGCRVTRTRAACKCTPCTVSMRSSSGCCTACTLRSHHHSSAYTACSAGVLRVMSPRAAAKWNGGLWRFACRNEVPVKSPDWSRARRRLNFGAGIIAIAVVCDFLCACGALLGLPAPLPPREQEGARTAWPTMPAMDGA